MLDNFYIKLFYISFPLILRSVLANFSGFIDSVMVGGLGSAAIAAVALMNQIFFVFICTLSGSIAGASIFSNQYFAIKDYSVVKKIVFIKFLIFISIFLCFSVLLYFLYEPLIISFMQNDSLGMKDDIIYFCNEYFFFAFISLIPFGITLVLSSTIAESGDTLKPMLICMCCVVLNTCLNYVFINHKLSWVPVCGVQGAALATFVSRALEMIIIIVLFLYKDFVRDKTTFFSIDKTLLYKITMTALPSCVNDFLYSFSFLAIMKIYALQAVDNIVIFSVISVVMVFFMDLISSLGKGAEIMIGYELGNDNFANATKHAYMIIFLSFIFGIILSVSIAQIAESITYYYSIMPSMKIYITECIHYFAYMFPFFTIYCVVFYILRSGGKTLLTTLIDGTFIWLLEIPLQFILIKFTNLNLPMVYLCVLSLTVLKCILGIYFITTKTWLNNLTSKTKQ